MKIAVNTRLLISNQLSGIGWFAYNVLKRIVSWHPEHQFIFLFDRKPEEKFIFGANVVTEILYPPTRHPVLWYLWFEHSLPKAVKKHHPDLFFSPDGHLSTKITKTPMLPVIHDINFHHDIKSVPWLHGLYWRYYFPRYAALAKRVVTVSEFSKNDISSFYHIDQNIIDVAYNGANDFISPLDEYEKQAFRDKFTQGCEYFIYVGVMVPRKNICRMVQAFEQFKASTNSNLKLLIVGDKLYFTPEMKKVYLSSSYKEDIVFTGRLNDEQMRLAIGAAISLVLVSTFEGFGIPVIEAMYADVPVITSNVSSLPEVAGNAALLADPFSVGSIKDAMVTMYKDTALRYDLISKGRVQREKFSWDKTASIVWQSIEKTVSG